MTKPVQFTLNGKDISIEVDEDRMLLWVLRTELGLTGTKFGCGEGFCGSCTVLVDGKAERSCQLPMSEVAGKEVVTIEGLAATANSTRCSRRSSSTTRCSADSAHRG